LGHAMRSPGRCSLSRKLTSQTPARSYGTISYRAKINRLRCPAVASKQPFNWTSARDALNRNEPTISDTGLSSLAFHVRPNNSNFCSGILEPMVKYGK
jgi:hypothetical protein